MASKIRGACAAGFTPIAVIPEDHQSTIELCEVLTDSFQKLLEVFATRPEIFLLVQTHDLESARRRPIDTCAVHRGLYECLL